MTRAEDDGTMAWQADGRALTLVGGTATVQDMAPERERFDCPTATFDGSLRDPRRLVDLYQQRMRAGLLAQVADEEAERESPGRGVLGACRDALGACEDGLRWLWLAEPRAARPEAPVTPRPSSARHLRLVPPVDGDIQPARALG